MRRCKFWLCTFLVFKTLVAFAGGWSSGGGELIKDSDNPWFLNNTTNVNYCILIDEDNFGASAEVVQYQVKQAITFWQQQFGYAIFTNFPDFGRLNIASQSFFETNCSDHTSLKFQFGILDKYQKEYLKDPAQYAAVTVRTEYNEASLKAKGFVYVSPLKGPISYASDRIIEQAWSIDDGNLLFLTLLHELGHIFGLQHMGSYGDLMSEGFVESILLKQQNVSEVQKITYPDFFSLKTKGRTICPGQLVLPNWQNFFEVEANIQCFKFEFEHESNNMIFGKTKMRIYASTSTADPMFMVSEIKLAMYKFFPAFTSIIWLPNLQGVFTQKDLEYQVGPGILGVSGLSVSKKGQFNVPSVKEKRTISVQFQQGKSSIFINGVLNGDLVPLL